MSPIAWFEQNTTDRTQHTGGGRLTSVDALRGLAALSVCWFHLTHGNPNFLQDGHWLKASGGYGWLGVEVFFVISGFIIPYAMHRGGYRLGRSPAFLLKRLARLEPPYLASIALILLLNWLASRTPGFAGGPSEVTAGQVAAHVGYLTRWLGFTWLSEMYWTLALELQFYLLIAFWYPLVAHHRAWVRWAALVVPVTASAMVTDERLGRIVVPYLGLFALGMACFQRSAGFLSSAGWAVAVAGTAAVISWAAKTEMAVAGVTAAAVISWVRLPAVGVFSWLGAISYSLYLTHTTVGGKAINLGNRFADSTPARAAVLVLALAASLVFAHLFYRAVERPSQRWAGRLRYGP